MTNLSDAARPNGDRGAHLQQLRNEANPAPSKRSLASTKCGADAPRLREHRKKDPTGKTGELSALNLLDSISCLATLAYICHGTGVLEYLGYD